MKRLALLLLVVVFTVTAAPVHTADARIFRRVAGLFHNNGNCTCPMCNTLRANGFRAGNDAEAWDNYRAIQRGDWAYLARKYPERFAARVQQSTTTTVQRSPAPARVAASQYPVCPKCGKRHAPQQTAAVAPQQHAPTPAAPPANAKPPTAEPAVAADWDVQEALQNARNQPTPWDVVALMVRLADVEGKRVLDPGAGDGRQMIAAMDAGAVEAWGIEIDPEQAAKAIAAIERAGYAGRCHIIEGDSREVEWPDVDVLLVHQFDDLMAELKRKIDRVATVVSYSGRIARAEQIETAGGIVYWRTSRP